MRGLMRSIQRINIFLAALVLWNTAVIFVAKILGSFLWRHEPFVLFAAELTHYSMRGYGEMKDIIQTLAVATAAAAIFCGWAVHYVHSLTP